MAIFYLDRYKGFRVNNEIMTIPNITIPKIDITDKTIKYKGKLTRFDILSEKYYNNPYHGFLIMAANPQYGGLEFDIPDDSLITIPFPFESAVERYTNEVQKYLKFYGAK